MQPGNPATYECRKSKTKGGALHRWEFNDDGIARCDFCGLELSAEDSADLARSNERSKRELGI